MSKGIVESIGGAALIASGIAVTTFSFGFALPLGALLIQAGAGLLINGIGTLNGNKGPLEGFATTTRNPIAPHIVIYGRARVAGTIVYPENRDKGGE